MKSVQQMVMDYMDECAEEFKRTVTVSKDWDNTGYVYMYKGDDAFKVRFNFQTDSCMITYPGQGHGDQVHYTYEKGMPLLKRHLRSFVKTGDPRRLDIEEALS